MDSELLYNCTVLVTLPSLYSVVHEIPQEANSGKIKNLGILGFWDVLPSLQTWCGWKSEHLAKLINYLPIYCISEKKVLKFSPGLKPLSLFFPPSTTNGFNS